MAPVVALRTKGCDYLRRNLVESLLSVLRALGFSVEEKLSQNKITLSFAGRENRFYLFGGRDEASASFIQGMTLCGVLFDEVALMPRSFVERSLARCSVDGAKFWFNCNPAHPQHWFYQTWITQADKRNCLYLHFLMRDNPSLSEDVIRRYETLYTGAFYDRFVRGNGWRRKGWSTQKRRQARLPENRLPGTPNGGSSRATTAPSTP